MESAIGLGAASVSVDERVEDEGIGRGGGMPEDKGGVRKGSAASKRASAEDETADGDGVAMEAVGEEEGVDSVELPLVGAALDEVHAPQPARGCAAAAANVAGRRCH